MSQNPSNPVSGPEEVLSEKVCLVSVVFGRFGGYRRLSTADLAKLGGTLPASSAVTEGSLKVFNPAVLKPFGRIAKAVWRELFKCGVRALGCSNVLLIPRSKQAVALKALEEAKKEFYEECDTLAGKYDELFEEHIEACRKEGVPSEVNDALEAMIRARAFTKEQAILKLKMDFQFFSYKPLFVHGVDPAAEAKDVVSGFARVLYNEVAGEFAKFAATDSIVKSRRLAQRGLGIFVRTRDKLSGLAFCSPTIPNSIRLIDDVLAKMPTVGFIQDVGADKPFSLLQALIDSMADPDDFQNASDRYANGASLLDSLMPSTAAPPVSSKVVSGGVTQPNVVHGATQAPVAPLVPGARRRRVVVPVSGPDSAQAVKPAAAVPTTPFNPPPAEVVEVTQQLVNGPGARRRRASSGTVLKAF